MPGTRLLLSFRRLAGGPLLAALAVAPCAAYLSWYPDYATLAQGADLVAIATPETRRELPAPAQVPGVSRNGEPVPAVEIETTFRPLAILRGRLAGPQDSFVLVHHRETEPDAGGVKGAGPLLADFQPGDGSAYLMFLKRRPDGRFQAFQENEPGWCILRLPRGEEPR